MRSHNLFAKQPEGCCELLGSHMKLILWLHAVETGESTDKVIFLPASSRKRVSPSAPCLAIAAPPPAPSVETPAGDAFRGTTVGVDAMHRDSMGHEAPVVPMDDARLPYPADFIPITYQNKSIGCLALRSSDSPLVGETEPFLRSFAKEIGYLIQRERIRIWLHGAMGTDTPLVGTSAALRKLEEEIERAGESSLPVVVEAEPGSAVMQIVAAIHLSCGSSRGPFVSINCSTNAPRPFREELDKAAAMASGGTLFLDAVDSLDEEMLNDVLHRMQQDVQYDGLGFRVIASVSHPWRNLVQEGRLAALRAQGAALMIAIPPLRMRREDIAMLLEDRLRRFRQPVLTVFSRDAIEALEAYAWPGNLKELDRVVECLAGIPVSRPIAAEDLKVHAPWIFKAPPKPGAEAPNTIPSHSVALSPADQVADLIAAKPLVRLARDLILNRCTGLQRYGSGMERALKYVAAHFHEDITLTELAKQSFFSSSHLSFRFKRTLGISFKGLLAIVRIERARQLLTEKPYLSITEVSLEVGFGDLSHFEKVFRRITGLCPREFRRRAGSQSGLI